MISDDVGTFVIVVVGSASGRFVINRPSLNQIFNSELLLIRIRIFTIFQRFKEISGKSSIFCQTDLTTYGTLFSLATWRPRQDPDPAWSVINWPSGYGFQSVIQDYRSKDPEPIVIFTDPQHWLSVWTHKIILQIHLILGMVRHSGFWDELQINPEEFFMICIL